MATALPHAPPPKAALPTAKAPTVHASPKPTVHSDHEHGFSVHLKAQLHNLAEKGHGEKAVPAKAELPGTKAKPVKLEAALEKPKEGKKTDHKEAKPETADAALLASLVVPKLEAAPKTAKPEADSGALSVGWGANKTLKTDRKPGAEPGAAINAHFADGKALSPHTGASTKAERSEERQKLFVVDRRSDKEKDKDKLKLPGAEAAAQQPVTAADLKTQAKVPDAKNPVEVQVAFQIAPDKHGQGFDLKPQNTPVSPRDAASFQQYLVEKGYGQLVDQARIVLKDQNAGEIRMTLYPESLGKVKVSLNLTDSSLAGQIFVENQTVKDVFQANMDGLMQAFRDGGWNDLSLQVSVGNGNGQQTGNGQTPFTPQARDYDKQVTQSVADVRTDRIGSWSDRQVNLTA